MSCASTPKSTVSSRPFPRELGRRSRPSISLQFKPLRRFRKYVFSHRGNSYRIVYEVVHEEDVVYVLMVGKREGFYERLKRRVSGS